MIGNEIGGNPKKREMSAKLRMRKMLDLYLDLLHFRLHINEEDYYAELGKIKRLLTDKFASKGFMVIPESNIKRFNSASTLLDSDRPGQSSTEARRMQMASRNAAHGIQRS